MLTPVGTDESAALAVTSAVRRIDTWARQFGGPRLRRVVRYALRLVVRGIALWRRSLQVRVVSLTVVLGLVATWVVGAFLANQVGERLLESGRDQAFRDAKVATNEFQRRLDTYTESASGPLEGYVRESLNLVLDTGGDSAVGVLLLRQPDSAPADVLTSYASGSLDPSIVPQILRETVRSTETQQSAQIALTRPDGRLDPGMLVGAQVEVSTAGAYELYFVVSLAREQTTLDRVQRVLAAGMASLVLLLGLIAMVVSRQVVRPVREAASVAGRLAQGNLDERMSPRGRDELASLARSFNEMADTLQDKIEAMAELSRLQRRFVSDVSHELRTPLTTIRMAAEVIAEEREDFSPTVARSSELLSTQLDRFESLLADLLEISRFDAGAAALEAEPADLGRLAQRVVEAAAPLAEVRGCAVSVHLPRQPVMAEVDTRRIERVLRNLVVNAIEHCESRPVEVWVNGDETTAAVLVADHGVGLREGDAERVFDRFWRADPARARTTGGTGLGLAISLEDARLHGGTLQAWGREGEGARFLMALPRNAATFVSPDPMSLVPTRYVPLADVPPPAATATDPGPWLDEEWFDTDGGAAGVDPRRRV